MIQRISDATGITPERLRRLPYVEVRMLMAMMADDDDFPCCVICNRSLTYNEWRGRPCGDCGYLNREGA